MEFFRPHFGERSLRECLHTLLISYLTFDVKWTQQGFLTGSNQQQLISNFQTAFMCFSGLLDRAYIVKMDHLKRRSDYLHLSTSESGENRCSSDILPFGNNHLKATCYLQVYNSALISSTNVDELYIRSNLSSVTASRRFDGCVETWIQPTVIRGLPALPLYKLKRRKEPFPIYELTNSYCMGILEHTVSIDIYTCHRLATLAYTKILKHNARVSVFNGTICRSSRQRSRYVFESGQNHITVSVSLPYINPRNCLNFLGWEFGPHDGLLLYYPNDHHNPGRLCSGLVEHVCLPHDGDPLPVLLAYLKLSSTWLLLNNVIAKMQWRAGSVILSDYSILLVENVAYTENMLII